MTVVASLVVVVLVVSEAWRMQDDTVVRSFESGGASPTARRAISISLTMRTPAARAAASGGASGGTPGLATTSEARLIRSRSWPPICTATPNDCSTCAAALADSLASDA